MRRLEEGVRSPGVDTAVSCPAWVLEADLGSSAKAVIHVLKDRAISAAPQADTEGKRSVQGEGVCPDRLV